MSQKEEISKLEGMCQECKKIAIAFYEQMQNPHNSYYSLDDVPEGMHPLDFLKSKIGEIFDKFIEEQYEK